MQRSNFNSIVAFFQNFTKNFSLKSLESEFYSCIFQDSYFFPLKNVGDEIKKKSYMVVP
jgi:hypothetical protein